MTKYEKELQRLKDYDEVQFTSKCKFTGYDFITTAGHGYLVIPQGDKYIQVAMSIQDKYGAYGFKGREAIYLEEDCEAPSFVAMLQSNFKDDINSAIVHKLNN